MQWNATVARRRLAGVFSFGGEQRNRGVEWGFFGTVLPGVRLMGGVAYVDPKLTRTAGGVNQGRTATGMPQLGAPRTFMLSATMDF